ncbi:hypothetical protein B0H17DRAFT_1146424 [Mycena rosella]|uniref:Uncharacterized protein n=1 Tax=Mycena rosella TaxID=1033263 RepID=A0AAD7CP37_MYCRO|nr:hypothetical protein B0H17DRAFT_1146424 [Mycena rosella]
MSDDTYQASSRATSLALEYEQNQEAQEAREAHEAQLSPAQLAREYEHRRLKRIRLGYEYPESPIKQEASSPVSAPRPTAVAAKDKLASLFASGEFLDSQTGDQTYVENLTGYMAMSQSCKSNIYR